MSKSIATVSLCLVCLLAGLAGFESVAHAQNFVAELGTIKAVSQSKETLGRVYVSGSKVRIETRDQADGFFVVNADQPAAWFVRPRQRVFMDARRSSPWTQVLVRVDPADACRQWEAMESIAGATSGGGGWRCERIGTQDVNGHEALKYEVTSRDGRRSYRWIDPLRQFPIRLESWDGSVVTLDAIVDAPQASTLFTVPAGFRKFDPLQLIEQIKLSDVWVEPHK
ncbi:MAG TPA: hypothetical protein VGG73_03515 [Vicinamibacterales bacterium]|jgi:hypothetical protein